VPRLPPYASRAAREASAALAGSALLVGACSVYAGCTAERTAAAHAVPRRDLGAPGTGQREEGEARSAEDGDAHSAVARMLAQMAAIRGLVPAGSVRTRVVGREQMVEAVRARLAADVPQHVTRGTEQLLFALGVVPLGFDYEASLLRLLGTQLAGFYDPDEQTMFLAADLAEAERSATLAHELVHALQDQHFDLGKRIKYREGAGDAQSAIHALAEGDATSAMADRLLARRRMCALDLPEAELLESMRVSLDQAEETASIAPILKRSVISPYVDGLRLVHWARRRGGWQRVNEIWRHLPESSEQLLHPEKLEAHEPVEIVPVPMAPRAGPSTLLYQDVLGELSVRLLLEERLPAAEARSGASDWGGDYSAVFCEAGRCAIAWHVRYDHQQAAQRALAGFLAALVPAEGADGVGSAGASGGGSRSGAAADGQRLKGTSARKAARPAGTCVERAERGPLALVAVGRDLAVVAGPYVWTGLAARSAGECTAALAWARAVARQQ
jgi:hypothetical protein